MKETALFERLLDAIDRLTALDDQAELYTELAGARARDTMRLCEEIDQTASTLSDPRSYDILDALHEVWAGAQKLHADAMKRNRTLSTFENFDANERRAAHGSALRRHVEDNRGTAAQRF